MAEYKPLNNIAYEHLRRMIYTGELKFKKVYSETKLAAELSISRTPMRDALNRLSQEHYIDILPSRGFMLHTPTQADIMEAYHIRMMIESYCGQIVAQQYPDARARATIGQMEDACELQRQLLDSDGNYSLSQFWMDDVIFHKALLGYINITSLCVQYDSVMHIFMPHHLIEDFDVSQKQARTLERHRSTLVEHAAITEALKSRDPEQVQAAIRNHLDAGLRALYESREG